MPKVWLSGPFRVADNHSEQELIGGRRDRIVMSSGCSVWNKKEHLLATGIGSCAINHEQKIWKKRYQNFFIKKGKQKRQGFFHG